MCMQEDPLPLPLTPSSQQSHHLLDICALYLSAHQKGPLPPPRACPRLSPAALTATIAAAAGRLSLSGTRSAR
jgi:hypothetical protein